ncbi:MAG: PAS domain-containing protein [Planctomycetota bacterium]|nr:MAG: PAS domain-containing protein [Planctomycetota bacterium]
MMTLNLRSILRLPQTTAPRSEFAATVQLPSPFVAACALTGIIAVVELLMALFFPALLSQHVGPVQAAVFRSALLAVFISPFVFGLLVQPLARAAEIVHRQHQTVVNDLMEGVVVVDCQGRIVECNPAARRMLGIEGEEFPPETRMQQFLANAKGNTHPPERWCQQASIESTLHSMSGTILDVEFTCRPLSRDDQPTFVLVLRDISARKSLERELEEKHGELLEASRRAGMAEISTGVLHNVGNVLNGVSVSAGLIRDRSQTSVLRYLPRISRLLQEHAQDLPQFLASPKGQDCISLIHVVGQESRREAEWMKEEIETLDQTLQHALEIIRWQQDAATGRRCSSMMDVCEVLDNALKICEASLRRHGVQVVRDYQYHGPVPIDHPRLTQILINLIGNAKHAFEGAQVQSKSITLRTAAADGGEIIIEIEDNGKGIPPERLARIFDFGYTTGLETNYGIGLHSCACLATELGARLSAVSPGEGGGACFRLSLPTHEGAICPV